MKGLYCKSISNVTVSGRDTFFDIIDRMDRGGLSLVMSYKFGVEPHLSFINIA
jgi:hypothetical protein